MKRRNFLAGLLGLLVIPSAGAAITRRSGTTIICEIPRGMTYQEGLRIYREELALAARLHAEADANALRARQFEAELDEIARRNNAAREAWGYRRDNTALNFYRKNRGL